MESVIGSKKYFKSLGPGAESDYYRHKTGYPTNNYSSSAYNTLGRCSTGPYMHLNNFPLHVDVGGEMGNPYRYNGWGMMNDMGSRKLAPSVSYSSSGDIPRKNRVKSFTILLLTAAFIVMLAVLSVAGLAFYFSTFKSEYSETVMAFEGEFMVVRGDVFTTGLKYNHTTTFDQKSQMYEKIINNGVTRGGLVVMHCEVFGFGDGPLINVMFRLYLDIRKIPTSISSVEDHIIESIISEFSVPNTLNSIKIDHHSVQVKRIIKTDLLGSAYLVKPPAISPHSTSFGSRPTIETAISGGPAPSLRYPSSSFASKYETTEYKEPPAPGIAQGTFEVTKTDADITQKKSSSSQFMGPPTTTLRPFNITNVGGAIKIKTKKTTIEKVSIPTKGTVIGDRAVVPTTETTRKLSTHLAVTQEKTIHTTTEKSKTTTITTTTLEEPQTTTTVEPSTTTSTTTQTPTTNKSQQSTTESNTLGSSPLKPTKAQHSNLPQLNEQLFTHSPVMDNKPWLPIDPTLLANASTNTDTHRVSAAEPLAPRTTTMANRIYHSFSNPAFVSTHQSIEPLGINAVRPYPIPVDKIHANNIEPVVAGRPVQSFADVDNGNHGNYEHLGDGIMVKKSETKVKEASIKLPEVTILSHVNVTIEDYVSSSIPPLLVATEIVETSIENRESDDDLPEAPFEPTTTTKPLSADPTSWGQPLFPMNLRPGSSDNSNKLPLNKVYNDTLQAWIVKNDQIENKANIVPSRPPSKTNIQNISVIFDTLASKLGITPNISEKLSPSLSPQSKSKLKSSTTPLSITTHETPTVTISQPAVSTEVLYGEAEIEEVDPTQYEEILRRDRVPTKTEVTSVAPTLITLMPVRSNSGLRLRNLRETNNAERQLPSSFWGIAQKSF